MTDNVQTEDTSAQGGTGGTTQSGQDTTQNGQEQTQTIAQGANGSDKAPEKPYWPEDWRQKVAEHYGAGNKDRVAKELRRLEGMTDPTVAYANWREMENTWATRKFVKLPGDDAKPEDIAAYHKALGVPEKPEDYVSNIKLEQGLVLGDDDKPIAMEFAKEAHAAGVTPQQFSKVINWYLKRDEANAAAIDEADDRFRGEAEIALKNELGNAYQRKTAGIASLFQTAAGGMDIKNEQGLYARLMGGRTADGQLIGNDPDMIRWLLSLNQEINPHASVVEDGAAGAKGVDEKIAEYEQRMRTDRRGWFKDEKAQAHHRELLAAREKIRARAR